MSDQELTISKAIEIASERFLSIAPKNLSFEAEKGFALQLLKNNSYLMDAAKGSPESLQYAITNVAAIGLSLNPAEKLAYLIPRAVSITVNGQKKFVTKVFLEPSYMGLIKLATDSGSIQWVQALPVYELDEFKYNGVGKEPYHPFNPFSKADRGAFAGVYCVAKTSNNDYLVTMMTAEQVMAVAARSESFKRKSGPWVTDFLEQAKKTVIRNAFKTWPRSNLNRMAEAVSLSNDNEGFEPILTSPNLGEYTAETKEYFDQLISKNDALGMYVLQFTLNQSSESTFNNLYHSFEKGQKGKYQGVVNELIKKGQGLMFDTVNAFIELVRSDDDLGAKQIIEDLQEDAIKILRTMLDADCNDYLNGIV